MWKSPSGWKESNSYASRNPTSPSHTYVKNPMQNATNIVGKTIKNCAKMVPRWYQHHAKMGAGRRRKPEKRWKHRREAPAGKERWESHSWRQKDLQMKLWVLKMTNLVPTLLANRTDVRPHHHFKRFSCQVGSQLAPKTEPKSKKNVFKKQRFVLMHAWNHLGMDFDGFGDRKWSQVGSKVGRKSKIVEKVAKTKK